MATVTPGILAVGVGLVEMFVQPITVRQRIMDRLQERLARIRIANGFFSDSGLEVVYGQLTEPNPDKTKPSAYIWDSEESSEREYGEDVIQLDVTVSLFELLPDHKTVPMEIRGNELLGDIKKGMILNSQGEPDSTVDRLASNLLYVSGSVEPGIRNVPWIQAITQWTVTYITPTHDPCAIKSQNLK